jgi:hypothetical protein
VARTRGTDVNGGIDILARRVGELETTVDTAIAELRTEVADSMKALRAAAGGPGMFLSDLGTALEEAVSTALQGAVESLRGSLTTIVQEAVERQAALSDHNAEAIVANIQHAVLLALSSFEESALRHIAAVAEPAEGPATARDLARVNNRIDELRALLLG